MIYRAIAGCVAILVIAVVSGGQARRPDTVGDLTGPDAVGFRKDGVTKETVGDRRAPANSPTTKQAIEDFLQLQKVNRQIQDIAKQNPLELEGIAAAAKEVGIRAKRLKTSLSLPSPPKDAVRNGVTASASTDELLNRIKELDTNIKTLERKKMLQKID